MTNDRVEINNTVKARMLDERDLIITTCGRSVVSKYISLSNASIFFINPSFSKKASAATKMGVILAMGKAIITNYGWGDVKEIVDEETGILVDEFTQQCYAKTVEKLFKTNYDPTKLRSVAEKYFSLE